jgi:hypothetical protein
VPAGEPAEGTGIGWEVEIQGVKFAVFHCLRILDDSYNYDNLGNYSKFT